MSLSDVAVIGYITSPYWVLDTDYTSWALVYSCLDLGLVHARKYRIFNSISILINLVYKFNWGFSCFDRCSSFFRKLMENMLVSDHYLTNVILSWKYKFKISKPAYTRILAEWEIIRVIIPNENIGIQSVDRNPPWLQDRARQCDNWSVPITLYYIGSLSCTIYTSPHKPIIIYVNGQMKENMANRLNKLKAIIVTSWNCKSHFDV